MVEIMSIKLKVTFSAKQTCFQNEFWREENLANLANLVKIRQIKFRKNLYKSVIRQIKFRQI